MKTQLRYKVLRCLCFFLAFSWLNTISAQTTHDVTVSNGSFSPANLAIAVGDIVKWTNTEGSHSVDGTTTTFPSNPVSFGNDIGAAGWTYTFTFSTEGVYDYRCGLHTTTMTGKITVGTSTGIDDVSANNLKHAYPNPVSNVLYVPVKYNSVFENKLLTLSIYNLDGKIVVKRNSDYMSELDVKVEALKSGIYIYEVSLNGKIIQSEKFVVK